MTNPPQTLKAKAKLRLMDLLAQRDHSERELKTKLKNYLRPRKTRFSRGPELSPEAKEQLYNEINEAIQEAIEHARTHKWLAEPEKISSQFGAALHRRKKGIHYINNYLAEKGLPPMEMDLEVEIEKAQELILKKFPDLAQETREKKAKAMRFLASRGFTMEVIRKVIK